MNRQNGDINSLTFRFKESRLKKDRQIFWNKHENKRKENI
jgi:hypothetical protein